MKKMNVAINGFGRIGRAAFKIMLDRFPNMNVVAVNDLTDAETLAHLLQVDSCYGRYGKKVSATKDSIVVGKLKVPVLAVKEPAQLPWKALKVDVVLECTGRFRSKEDLSLHLQAGAKKVILSAPAKKGGVKTIVLGVNENKVGKSDHLVSCASCTTNCLAPSTAVIKDAFGIKKALMTTVHSYTADQNLVDGPHKDLRRARAAAINMVPTTTGAAIATTETIPALKDKFDGLAVRVPTPVGSLCDTVYLLNKKTTAEAVNAAFKKAANGKLKGILEASSEELVSTDIIGNPHSSIVDLLSTKVVGGDLLKVIAWYDNEWGYSNRLVELAAYLGKFIK
ncbi:MAG: type I glyceraldehyde-3-phosphate dehydrogenase [Candidatus Falkowbacteria bacterium]|nr:MAG: type I glyceraldehyde-3-phosphate dehydrogenase [Candidatus Falkowbacteria bacterium]